MATRVQFINAVEDSNMEHTVVLGPYTGLQITYAVLRDTLDGDEIAVFGSDGYWHIYGNDQTFTDLIFTDEGE